jgi:hypothetical protein
MDAAYSAVQHDQTVHAKTAALTSHCCCCLAQMNKSLAQTNKSTDVRKETKKRTHNQRAYPMKHILLAAAALGALTHAATGQEARVRPQVPVVIQADQDTDSCGNGVVVGLDPHGDGFLAVKAGPDLGFARIDKLYNGEDVLLCGYLGNWFAVVYTKDGRECNVMRGWLRTMPYTGPCRSGWVHRRWIKVIAG